MTGIVTIRHHEGWYRCRTSCRRNCVGQLLARFDCMCGGGLELDLHPRFSAYQYLGNIMIHAVTREHCLG
jgi:hypothetical protein